MIVQTVPGAETFRLEAQRISFPRRDEQHGTTPSRMVPAIAPASWTATTRRGKRRNYLPGSGDTTRPFRSIAVWMLRSPQLVHRRGRIRAEGTSATPASVRAALRG